MRALVPLASLVCCFAASDPAMLQQGVDVGNSVAWTSIPSLRGCITMMHPVIKGSPFMWQQCSQDKYSFMAASMTKGEGVGAITGGGRLDWPCAGFACSPSGGTIWIEKQFFKKTKNDGTADDNHGAKSMGPVEFGGHMGMMVSLMVNIDTKAVDITVTVSGRLSMDIFQGLVHASGTLSGMIKFYKFKICPTFGWEKVTLSVELRASVRIGVAEFNVACQWESDGGWKVSISLGFFRRWKLFPKQLGA